MIRTARIARTLTLTPALLFAFLFALGAGAGEPASDPGYDLVRGASPTVRAGEHGSVSLSIVPRAGSHLLASGPVLVRVTGDGLRPTRALYHREDAVDPLADVPRFELAFTAERPGEAHLTADCTFYLCKSRLCRPVQTRATFALTLEGHSPGGQQQVPTR